MQNAIDLTGKVALITGASSGIGAATAGLFAEFGAKVSLSFHHNNVGAEQVRDKIIAAGGDAIVTQADVRQVPDIHSLVNRTVKELGTIDILVNNAGSLIERMRILEVKPDKWDEVMNLNLKSAVICSQAVSASMIARKCGAIVNVVSIAGRNGGGPGAGAYSAAKAGLIAFTKSLAKELAPNGVRVNAISPGVIDTLFHEVFSTPEMMRSFVTAIPLGRVGTPLECANVIAFLASDAAGYIVGETVEVNGGLMML
jgi:3-oxoacyl-[acyl-carrier protein] reductase